VRVGSGEVFMFGCEPGRLIPPTAMNQSLPAAVNAQTAASDQAGNRADPSRDERGSGSAPYAATHLGPDSRRLSGPDSTRGQAEADLSAGRAITTGILPTAASQARYRS
jgi:hypothetical protein